MIQENRSFDNLFATFPGADGTTQGKMKTPSGYQYVPLQKMSLNYPCDFGHSYNGVLKDYDGGNMDGFGFEGGGKRCPGEQATAPYQYVDPLEIAPYWQIAQTYVLGDHMFQTQGSGSFTAHQDLIAGGSTIDPEQTKTLIDFPSKKPWGCDAPKGTKTSLIIAKGSSLQYRYHHGPFPCLKYATLRDLLDAAGLSWRYYTPPEPGGIGALWNGFDAIDAVRNGPEWTTNIVSQTQIFTDITAGALPAVSWVIPTEGNSDHPGNSSDTGPSWVGTVVNAIGESQYWNSTAIVVVWDDWGGFYDHVPPPFFDRWGGLGFRVPLLIASPYARQGSSRYGGYVSHTQYEFGSILKFIEDISVWDAWERPTSAPIASAIRSTSRRRRARSLLSERSIRAPSSSISRRRTPPSTPNSHSPRMVGGTGPQKERTWSLVSLVMPAWTSRREVNGSLSIRG